MLARLLSPLVTRLTLPSLVLAVLLVPGVASLSPTVSPPALAADLFTELRTYPGVALVPPDGLVPFEELKPWRVEIGRPRANAPLNPSARYRYLIQYSDPEGGTGSAQIGGTMGDEEFGQTLRTLSGLSFKRCSADAAYCTENIGGQDGAALASELFRGLAVGSSQAVAEHVVCCGGHYWTLTWYDAGRDMTYEVVLVGPIADRYGTEITSDNQRAAQAIAEIAAQLVALQ